MEIYARFASANSSILNNRVALASQGLLVLALPHKLSHWSASLSNFTDEIAPDRKCFERDLISHGLIGSADKPRMISLASLERWWLKVLVLWVTAKLMILLRPLWWWSDAPPGTKVCMIKALHRRDCYLGMTGDGINDSPRLKRADIGIAMGSDRMLTRNPLISFLQMTTLLQS